MSLEAQPLDDLKTAPDALPIPLEPAPSRDGFSVKTASLYFGSSSLGGSAESMERWQPGEEPSIVMPVALPDPDMKVTASLPAAAAGRAFQGRRERRERRPQGRSQFRQPARQDAGRAARPARREIARQIREVPRRSGLFRGPRRSRARPDRGGAGGDEPHLLRLLSDHGMRRGLPEQAPPLRLPVHLRLRQQSPMSCASPTCGTAPRRSPRRCSTASSGCRKWRNRRTTMPIGCTRPGSAK